MKVAERPEIAETLKRRLAASDPDRDPVSVTRLIFCPGKAAIQEWKSIPWPFQKTMFRGHQAEAAIRKGRDVLDTEDSPPTLSRDGVVAHPDDFRLTPRGVVEYKSTDYAEWGRAVEASFYEPSEWDLEQLGAYAHMAGRTEGLVVKLWYRAKGADITVHAVSWTSTELARLWRRLLRRKPKVDEVIAWARGNAPSLIPSRYRKPRFRWECKACQLKVMELCPGAK